MSAGKPTPTEMRVALEATCARLYLAKYPTLATLLQSEWHYTSEAISARLLAIRPKVKSWEGHFTLEAARLAFLLAFMAGADGTERRAAAMAYAPEAK